MKIWISLSNINDKGEHMLITEEYRIDSYFANIAPKSILNLFKEMQVKAPNEILGFSVMVEKFENKEVRVSCFGIQRNLLTKLC